MNWGDYAQAVLALIFVLGLIGLITIGARRLGFGSPTPTLGNKNKRVVILEVTNLDMKRRLVLIRRDKREHLILLGISGEHVVESFDPLETDQQQSFANTLKPMLKQDSQTNDVNRHD